MSATASDFNLEKLSTKELPEMLRATIEYGGNIFMCARRGTGKSQMGKQAIRDMRTGMLYLNSSTMERTDAMGFPRLFNVEKKDYVDFILPYYYKELMEGKEPITVFFDEIDKISHDVIAPLLEFTQEHMVNGRHLPNLKAVFMAGNLVSEGGQRPPLPLLDRAEKYLVEGNTTQWLDWACKEGEIHPSITAYINDHGNDLFGEVDCGDMYADPSPRGWHNASMVVSFGEKHRWGHRVLTHKVAGYVGKKVGIKYAAYFDHYTTLLPICASIMEGKDIKGFDALEPSKQCVACMIVCSRVARILDETKDKRKKKGDLPREVDTVGKFMAKVDPELALVATRSQIGLDRTVEHDIDSHPIWGGILTELARRIRG
jgi:hypothetical protein